MAVTATILDHTYVAPALYLVRGTFTFTGNYATGGEVPTYPGLKTARTIPLTLVVQGGGYMYEFIQATGALLIRQGDNANGSSAPAVQLAAAAYPAGVTGATVTFQALFKKANG